VRQLVRKIADLSLSSPLFTAPQLLTCPLIPYLPIASLFLEVGLLYRQGWVGENVRKVVAVCLASK